MSKIQMNAINGFPQWAPIFTNFRSWPDQPFLLMAERFVRIVRDSTLLGPDIVEAILDGRQPAEMTLAVLMRPLAVAWREQQMAIRFGLDTSEAD
jgi:hypothetical protein